MSPQDGAIAVTYLDGASAALVDLRSCATLVQFCNNVRRYQEGSTLQWQNLEGVGSLLEG